MSIAPREHQWPMRPMVWAGHSELVQRQATASPCAEARETCAPLYGQLFGGGAEPGFLGHLEAERFQPLEHLDLGLRPIVTLSGAKAIDDKIQRPFCNRPRVELFQRSGGGVARIGKKVFSGCSAFSV